jgi:hypothetical protein
VQPERSSVLVGPQGLIPKTSDTLTVDYRGFLRCGNLYAGPLVRQYGFTAFTSTSEAPRDRSTR